MCRIVWIAMIMTAEAVQAISAPPLPVGSDGYEYDTQYGGYAWAWQSDGWCFHVQGGDYAITTEYVEPTWYLDFDKPGSTPWRWSLTGSIGTSDPGNTDADFYLPAFAPATPSLHLDAHADTGIAHFDVGGTITTPGYYFFLFYGIIYAGDYIDGVYNVLGYDITFKLAPVPEPATWALMATGLLGLAAWRRRA